MKRSRKVEIALVSGLAMAGCGRGAYDPCAARTFNQEACQQAIRNNGYYYGGHWYSHGYSSGFSNYYNDYYSYVRNGGNVTQIAPSEWARPAGAPATGTSSSSSVSRGIFGASSHGTSGGE